MSPYFSCCKVSELSIYIIDIKHKKYNLFTASLYFRHLNEKKEKHLVHILLGGDRTLQLSGFVVMNGYKLIQLEA